MIDLEVYTVGGIDFLVSVFRALVLFLGGSPIESFVKFFVLLSALTFVLMAIFGRDKLIFLKQFPIVVFLLNLTFAPIVNLTIIDTKTGHTEVVRNFPFIPGFLISFFSNTSDFLVQAIDNLFHTGLTISVGIGQGVPIGGGVGVSITDLDYRRVGFAGVADISGRVLDYKFENSPDYFEFYNKLLAYMDQCFLVYITTLKDTEKKQILTSPDLFSKMRVVGWLMEYEGQVYYCNEFYDNVLSPAYKKLINDLQKYPEKAGFDINESVLVPSQIAYLTRLSYDFASAVAQAGLIHALHYAILVKMSDNEGVLGAYIAGRTLEQNKVFWRGLGYYASQMLPKLRDYLIAIAVFFSFLLIPMILLPFFGGTSALVLVGYARYIMWVYLWDPLLALTDAGLKIWAINKTNTFLIGQGINGITFATISQIRDTLDWYPAIGGYIAGVMVPSLAWMFVKGFEMGVSAVAYMFGGQTQAQISKELQEMHRNISREYANVKLGSEFRNAGEMMAYYEAIQSEFLTAAAYTYKHLEDQYGRDTLVRSLSEVPTLRNFGQGLGMLRASSQVRMPVEELSAFQTHMSQVKQALELTAFQQFVNTLGTDRYVKTRLMELYNETAKMEGYEKAAQILGYTSYDWDKDGKITNRDINTGLFMFLFDKHMTNNQMTINEDNRLALAKLLEPVNRDIAQRILRGDYDGATVNFNLYRDSEGNFKLGRVEISKGAKAETFDIQQDIFVRKTTFERSTEFQDVSILQAAYNPEAKEILAKDITRLLAKAVNEGGQTNLLTAIDTLREKFTKELSSVYSEEREVNQNVSASVSIGANASKFIPKSLQELGEKLDSDSLKDKALGVVGKVAKSLSDKADILQGKLYTQGEAGDSQEVNKLNLYVKDVLENFVEKLATSGILNDKRIDPYEEKLVEHFVKRDLLNPLIEKIRQAEGIAHGDKTV